MYFFKMYCYTNTIHMEVKIMDIKEQVLAAMKEANEPINAGKVAEIANLDRKDVDKAMAALKKEGAIVSPIRCKWEPANK